MIYITKPILLLLLFLLNLQCSGNSNAETVLDEKVQLYKKCYVNKDFICMSSMIMPSVIEQLGGVEGFIEMMNGLPALLEASGMQMDASQMTFKARGDLVNHDGTMVSIIPTLQPVKINGMDGNIESSVMAFSDDNGESWFFLEGSDEGKMTIANASPALLQKIDIPTPTLKLGDKTLVQKNGQWTQQ